MTKDELNRKWAELEGWTDITSATLGEVLVGESPYTPEGHSPREEIPDFTEPNRFFAEVVPRMAELSFTVIFDNIKMARRPGQTDMIWSVEWCETPIGRSFSSKSYSLGEAGLDAAIKAREALDA